MAFAWNEKYWLPFGSPITPLITVGAEIAHTFPSDYRLALQAMNKGRPLVLDGQHELSKAFSAFARELAGVRAPAPQVEKVRATGLFGRLAPRKA